MTVLNSLPLWGALAALGVIVPILIHLLNKARPKKVQWAAMELLQRVSQQKSRNIKLKDLLLMALRSLTLLLAALAMMRLVFTGSAELADGTPRDLVLAIDASYSMNHGQFESRLSQAKRQAVQIVKSLPSGSQLSLVVMGSEPEVLMRHSDPDVEVLQDRLDTLEAQPVSLALADSLEAIDSLLKESDGSRKELILITDTQQQDWTDLTEGAKRLLKQLGETSTASILQVSDEAVENLAISDLQMVSGVRRLDGFASLTASVVNYGNKAAASSVQLSHNDQEIDSVAVGPLQPGERQIVRLGSHLDQAGPNRFVASLAPDSLGDDNQTYLALDIPERLSVLMVEGRDQESRYLDLALQLQRSGYASGLDVSTVLSASVGVADIEQADIIVLANVSDLPDDVIDSLESRVAAGAGLLVYGGDQVDDFSAERVLGQFLPFTWGANVLPDAGEKHTIQLASQTHRLAPELVRIEPELADSVVSAYHPVEVDDQSSVLLNLSNGSPLLVTRDYQAGRVAFVATGPGRQWSSLPLSPAGPIVFHLLLDELSAGGERRSYQVGESMEFSASVSDLGAEPKLLHPDGQSSAPQRMAEQSDVSDILLDLGKSEVEGFYQLDLGGHGEIELVAANLDTRESAVQPTSVEDLQLALADTGIQIRGNEQAAEPSTAQTHTGSYFALAALLMMIAQAALSSEMTRRKQRKATTIRTGYGVGVGAD